MGQVNYKNFVLLVLCLVFLLSLTISTSAFSGGGSGTSGDPFQITNCTQLQEINNSLNSHYILMNDVDCSDTVNWNGGLGFLPLSPLNGSLNGRGFKVSGLFINSSISGLFGILNVANVNLSISNLKLDSVYIVGSGFSGGLIGSRTSGSINISNCSVSGFVSGTRTGGLVGQFGSGTIINSYSTANVSGSSNTGGLVGYTVGSAYIYNCYSTGLVTGATSGGLIGGVYSSYSINNSYWDNQTSNKSTSYGGAGVVGKTTAEMMTQSTFVGWDFVNVWQIDEGVSYPSLLVFNVPVCVEDWVRVDVGACDGLISSYIIEYEDQNMCGTFVDLPVDDGAVVDCCVEDWFGSYGDCRNGVWTLSYSDLNVCGTTYQLPVDNGAVSSCVEVAEGGGGATPIPVLVEISAKENASKLVGQSILGDNANADTSVFVSFWIKVWNWLIFWK